MSDCQHEIGRKVIGGIPGHEHYHPTGNQLCLNCGRYLHEILSDERADERARLRKAAGKLDYHFDSEDDEGMAEMLYREDVLSLLEEPGDTER